MGKDSVGRTAARVAGLTALAFVCLVVLLELLLRATIGVRDIHPASALYWQINHAETQVHEADPPLFTIDAQGIQVGHDLTPGTNADGYRTPPFDEPADGRPTVLFFGDSFTWGDTARPYSHAFVDQVRAAGYKTINLGVPATGATQYAAQAKRYLPALRPDAVCVMIYTDNDFDIEGPIRPGLKRTYVTNIGMFYATTEEGEQLTLEGAVARRRGDVPGWLTPDVAEYISRYALVRFSAGIGAALTTRYQDPDRALVHLREVRAACEAVGAPMYMFLISPPPVMHGESNSVTEVSEVLAEFSPLTPGGFVESDYRPMPDVHYNNAGHAKMAASIVEKLRAEGHEPRPGAGPTDEELYLVKAQPTLAEFCAAIQVGGAEALAIGRDLRRMRLTLASALLRPSPDGGAPLQLLADLRKADPSANMDSPEFLRYCETHHFESGPTYAEVIEGAVRETFVRIGRRLDPGARALLRRVPMERFMAIQAGGDPILAKADAMNEPAAAISWAEFTDALEPNTQVAAALRREIEGMQAELATWRTATDPVAAERAIGEIAERRHIALFGLMTPNQIAICKALPMSTLANVRLEEENPVSLATARHARWIELRARLNLRDDQEEIVAAALREYKAHLAARLVEGGGEGSECLRAYLRAQPDPLAAVCSAEFLDRLCAHACPASTPDCLEALRTAEERARAALRVVLDDKQERRLRMMVKTPLAALEIPEDPILKAIGI